MKKKEKKSSRSKSRDSKKSSKSKDKKSSKKKDKKSKKSKSDKNEKSVTFDLKNGNQLPSLCVMHKAPLEYYCETCDEPVCHLCITLGPHNNQVKNTKILQKSCHIPYKTQNSLNASSIQPLTSLAP